MVMMMAKTFHGDRCSDMKIQAMAVVTIGVSDIRSMDILGPMITYAFSKKVSPITSPMIAESPSINH